MNNKMTTKIPQKKILTSTRFKDPAGRLTKIYVGNLDYSMEESDIHKLFVKFGKIGKILVIRDKKTNRSTGIAFLQMYNREHAENAIQKLNGQEVNGRTLKVSVALEREKLEQKVRKVSEPQIKKPLRRKRKFDFNFSPKS